jgi:Uma2 family endonuclease
MSAIRERELPLRRWTRAEYDRMVDIGLLGSDDHVELIDGEIITMAPQKSLHATVVGLAQDALSKGIGPGMHVRVQSPVALDADSEPEPDLVVVRGERRDYLGAHPAAPLLIVEVSDSTLSFDRTRKAAIYARSGIAEYWIVNIVDRVLEVHRGPGPAPTAALGFAYAAIERLGPGDVVAPLAVPRVQIAVGELLP